MGSAPVNGQHALFLDQDPAVLAGPLGVVGVIDGYQLQLAPVYAASGIDGAEVSERSVADILAELLVGSRERTRLADQDGGPGHALGLCGAGRQEARNQACGN